jgi:hypothetical protein
MFCPHCGKEVVGDATFCSGCGTRLTGAQPAKNRRLSTAAGILEIVGGSLDMLAAIVLFVIVVVSAASRDGAPPALALVALAAAIIGGIAIAGGSCALRRRNWGMALAGAIVILWPVTLLGIAALILTVLSKDEFEQGPSA